MKPLLQQFFLIVPIRCVQVHTTATIYRQIREAFDNSMLPPSLRVVLDFKRVSISAAKRIRDFINVQHNLHNMTSFRTFPTAPFLRYALHLE